MRRRRIWLGIILSVAAVLGVAYVLAGMYRARYYRSLRQYYTLICVGHACLQYQAATGSPPGSVADLFRTGFLRRSDDNQSVDTKRGSHGWGSAYRDAIRVKLSLPARTDEYEMRGGFIVDKATGEPVTMVDIDDPVVWPEHVRMANKALAEDWLRMVRGEPLEDW